MFKCYLCQIQLNDDNISYEHIIPKSIGGRYKSKNLICKECNNSTGHLFDREFSKLGNIIGIKYNIKRENGYRPFVNAIEVSTGKKLIIKPGNISCYVEPQTTITDTLITVQHHDKKRAVEETIRLNKKIGGQSINKNEIFFEHIIEGGKNFIIDRIIEPDLLLRSVCKTMINFYVEKTGNYQDCLPVIEFLRTEIENRFAWFLDLNLAKKCNQGAANHILIIKGNKKAKSLYAYFEIFGEVGFIALLNGKYLGNDIHLNFSFDPINSLETKFDHEFSLKTGDVIDHILKKPDPTYIKCVHESAI